MRDSRLPGLYRLSVGQRIDALSRGGWLGAAAARRLKERAGLTDLQTADRMSENVIGVFGLPLAVAPNFVVNSREYVVPMVVEEPSVVAGLSGAARAAREGGGFQASSDESLLPGQILVAGPADADAAARAIRTAAPELLAAANDSQPNLLGRGGGAREIDASVLRLAGERPAVLVQLLVDTCDAMGANIVNSMCERIASDVERLAGGRALVRILSNLADRSLVRASVVLPLRALAGDRAAAERLRDRIVTACRFADADPHRAATQNKGIMNGIDGVAVATGNDWRALEAGAHAFAARDGRYRSLARWLATVDGALRGELVMPIKVGIVGGSLRANPAVDVSFDLLRVTSARQLREVMGAVGLAQNFAALRALVTEGIQKGHLRLHARSVAASVGTPPEQFERVVAGLIASGEVKAWKAERLLQETTPADANEAFDVESHGRAAGKVIVLGEHAVVYGRHALALPIPDAVFARVCPTSGEPFVAWRYGEQEQRYALVEGAAGGLAAVTRCILENLGLEDERFELRLVSRIPPAAGLGASAAVAVAVLRALDRVRGLCLDEEAIDRIAFECEKLAHGNPSGIDNRLAASAKPLLFRRDDEPLVKELALEEVPPLVVAVSGTQGITREQVDAVRRRYERAPERYNAIFDEIDAISLAGVEALLGRDYDRLGVLMNVCHGLLNALEVSTPELERMVAIARANGAAGAKLTGAGGGGSVLALCPGTLERVAAAMRDAGYRIVSMTGSARHRQR